MTREEQNKRAFIIAAMVILLCLVAITGATLALFTSNLEDGTIGINATAGTLKVDIISAEDETQSLVGDVLTFVDVNGNTDVLFEPGAVYHTQGFRVKNIGEIPIHFIVYISNNEKVSEDFAKAFEFWITPDPTDRDGMVKLSEFDGKLEPGFCSGDYYLVFKMKESAGNEFMNRPFTGVGITVCAVQGNIHIDKGVENGTGNK